jgi:hypothetical protein
MSEGRKQLKKDYLRSSRPMGVFLVRNNLSNKVFLATGMDLHGIINRHKFQLMNGTHPNTSLQADWNEFGSNNFAFEIVDELRRREGVELDYKEELGFLEKLWLEKLQPFGERGYNAPKLTKAERLRRIRQNRKGSD